MSKIRIAINAIPFSQGGGLTGLLGLCRGFDRLADECSIVVFAAKPETIRDAQSLGVTVEPVATSGGLLQRSFWQLSEFNNELQRLDCDVLISTNSMVPGISIPQIVHHQNLWCFTNLGLKDRPKDGMLKQVLRQRIAKYTLRRAHANVFVSEYLREVAEEVARTEPANSCVIHNGLDEAQLQSARNHLNTWCGEPIICAVQPNVRQKDSQTLVRALAALVAMRADVPWSLRIAGGGDWTTVLNLAKELNVLDRVHLEGHLGRQQLDELLGRSLCLMFTSYFESFGNPPIEAMSQGCPVIAVNATAMPEVIADAGVLVNKGDYAAFADTALRMWDDRAFRDRCLEKGHQRACVFDWNESASRFLGLAQKLVAARGSQHARLEKSRSPETYTRATCEAAGRTNGAMNAVQFHEMIAPTWERKYRRRSFRAREVVIDECLQGSSQMGSKWLDAGCGTGSLSRTLATRGSRVLGVDAARAMVEIAGKEAQRTGLGELLEFAHVDSIESMPLARAGFDGILCNSVVEYLHRPVVAIEEMTQCLRPGGMMLISVPNRASLFRTSLLFLHRISRLLGQKPLLEYLRYSINSYHRDEFSAILQAHGLEVMRVVPFGGPMPRALQRLRFLGPLNMYVARKAGKNLSKT